MILFAFEAYQAMGAALAKSGTLGRFRVGRFENGELHLGLQTLVRNENCFVLGSISPPDEQLLSVLLLAHTLKKEGARRVTAILPYLAYTRDDKDKPGESLATAWAGALAQASGVDEVITVDVHSERAKGLFPISVRSLSPATLFAEELKRCGLSGATIVAPDEGAIGRCEAVQKAAGTGSGKIPYFEKQRTAAGITHTGLIGAVGRQAVIVDDILDTGGTLLSACEKLRESGVEEITVMVTHGLFTGERWKQLRRLGVKRIFCTDSVPLAAGVCGDDIERLKVTPLLAEELCSTAKT
ncbi:MAG: ribose-phosphate diphosphokinase [Bryobacteraceae bacterium]|jgi:ribose-phosphate pyrophosphokinase